METSVEQLIKERAFASLTGEELAQVKELCETEEEFQTMKQFFRELESVSASRKTIINPEIKNSLDGIFSAKHPGLRANWTAPEVAAAPVTPVIPLHQRTWVRIAAAAILILGTAPFWGMLKNDLETKDKGATAQLQKPKTGSTAKPEINSDAAPGTGNFKSKIPVESIPSEQEVLNDEATAERTMAADAAPMDAMTYQWSAPAATYKVEMSDGIGRKNETLSQGFFSSAPTANGMVQLGATSAVTYSYNLSAGSPVTATTFSSHGREADLHPNDGRMANANGVNEASLAEQPDDLLDLLVPAF